MKTDKTYLEPKGLYLTSKLQQSNSTINEAFTSIESLLTNDEERQIVRSILTNLFNSTVDLCLTNSEARLTNRYDGGYIVGVDVEFDKWSLESLKIK